MSHLTITKAVKIIFFNVTIYENSFYEIFITQTSVESIFDNDETYAILTNAVDFYRRTFLQ